MQGRSSIILVAGLFAVYLILKWVGRLLFGLLDYAILIAIVVAIFWYVRLPSYRKAEVQRRIITDVKTGIKAIGQKLGLD